MLNFVRYENKCSHRKIVKQRLTTYPQAYNCMIPRQSIGVAIDSVRKTDAQDFANLMPRPGWQNGLGLLNSVHL